MKARLLILPSLQHFGIKLLLLRKMMWAWIRSDNGSVRMILRFNAFIKIVKGFYDSRIG